MAKGQSPKINRLQGYAKKSSIDYRDPNPKISDDLKSIPEEAPEDLVRELYCNVLLGDGSLWGIPASCKQQHFGALLAACDDALSQGATVEPICLRFLFGRVADSGSLLPAVKNKSAHSRFVKCAKALQILEAFWGLPEKKSDWKSHRVFATDDDLANAAAEALTLTGRCYQGETNLLVYWGMVLALVRSANPKSLTCLRRLVQESVADPMLQIGDDDYLNLLYRMLSLHDDAKVASLLERVQRCLTTRNRQLPAQQFAATCGMDVPLRWYLSVRVDDTRAKNTTSLTIDGGVLRDWKITLNELTNKPRATYAAGKPPRLTNLKLSWKPQGPGDFLEFLRRIAKQLSLAWDIEHAFVHCSVPKKDRDFKNWLSTL